MKAVITSAYGSADVLDVREMPAPAVKDGAVLVKVAASAVTTADWRLRASDFPAFAWLPGRLMFGLFRPRNPVPGMDFSGTIVAKGKAVTHFEVGDTVFGSAGHGAHAEFLSMPADGAIALKPENLSHEDAAAVPFGALTALVFLRDFAKLREGQRVLVLGASGGVGVFAVQLAKHFGATVTGVTSTDNCDLVRSLGADRVIDYTREDYAAETGAYDLVFDTAGVTTFSAAKRMLAPGGLYIPLEFGLRDIIRSLLPRRSESPRISVGVSGEARADVEYLRDLLESGAIRPVIDRVYPLTEIRAAHRRVESRHKRGSVVLKIGEAPVSTGESPSIAA